MVQQTLLRNITLKGSLQWDFYSRGESLGPTLKLDKWEFTAKEQGGHQWLENYSEEMSELRGFWLNEPTRIHSWRRQAQVIRHPLVEGGEERTGSWSDV